MKLRYLLLFFICCIYINAQAKLSITNGTITKYGQYPYFAAVLDEGTPTVKGLTAICGATLISPDWVLTAAHCVMGASHVLVGYYCNGSKDCYVKGQQQSQPIYAYDRPIDQAYIDYNYYSHSAPRVQDIGLFHLATPIPSNYPTIRLYNHSFPLIKPSQLLTTIGVGETEALRPSDILKQTVLQVVDYKDCEQGKTSSSKYLICTKPTRNQSYDDHGDSGGPLIEMINDQPYEVGVADLVVFAKNKPDYSNHANNGFMRVSTFINWINNVEHHQNTAVVNQCAYTQLVKDGFAIVDPSTSTKGAPSVIRVLHLKKEASANIYIPDIKNITFYSPNIKLVGHKTIVHGVPTYTVTCPSTPDT